MNSVRCRFAVYISPRKKHIHQALTDCLIAREQNQSCEEFLSQWFRIESETVQLSQVYVLHDGLLVPETNSVQIRMTD